MLFNSQIELISLEFLQYFMRIHKNSLIDYKTQRSSVIFKIFWEKLFRDLINSQFSFSYWHPRIHSIWYAPWARTFEHQMEKTFIFQIYFIFYVLNWKKLFKLDEKLSKVKFFDLLQRQSHKSSVGLYEKLLELEYLEGFLAKFWFNNLGLRIFVLFNLIKVIFSLL